MFLTLLILPLLSAILLIFFSRLFVKNFLFISLFNITFSAILSLILFIQLNITNTFYYVTLTSWFVSDSVYVVWGFLFDSLTCTLICVVTFISFSVHLYSIDYMKYDRHRPRFLGYLSLFTFFMLVLLTADNFLQMFLGWEGVGICSFLLINFWTTRIQANKAGIKAMLFNKVGDCSLILSIIFIFYQYNSFNYAIIFTLTPYLTFQNFLLFNYVVNIGTCITLFIFLGAVGKSAQLGLHAWLADAMEGPTPVSALIHSATMVTAGVFLLIRVSPLLEYSPAILQVITIVGALTTFCAATIGIFQNDIKRIIAYSTCSQLGYMIFSCGLSNYTGSVFHLFNHAFFKAVLFLCSGAVIHALYDEQDIRKMGGLKNLLPFTYSIMCIASFALLGFPFLSGFYSKDFILEVAYTTYTSNSFFAYTLGCLAAFCTAFYSIRLLYLVFLSAFNGFRASLIQVHDVSIHIYFAFLLLIIPTIFIGFFSKDLFIGLGTTFWGTSIFILPQHFHQMEHEFIPFIFKIIPLIFSLFGIFSSLILFLYITKYNLKVKLTSVGLFFFNFFNRKWYFDKLNNIFFSQTFLKISYQTTYQIIDRGIIEFFGPFGISFLLTHLARTINQVQTASLYLYCYLFLTFLAGIFLISYFFPAIISINLIGFSLFFIGGFEIYLSLVKQK